MTERSFLHLHLQHRVHLRLQRGFRLRCRHARFQPPECVYPAGPAVGQHFFIPHDDLLLHHDGNEDFRRISQLHSVKSRLHHADDGHVVAVHDQFFPDDSRISAEPLPPEVVRQHHQAMPVGNAIVLRREGPPQDGVNPKSVEVRSRNEFRPHALRLAAKR